MELQVDVASLSKLTGGLLVWRRGSVPPGQAQSACTNLLMSTPLIVRGSGRVRQSGDHLGGEGRSRGSSKMPPPCAYHRKACAGAGSGVRVWGETAAKSKQDGPLRKPSSVDVSTGSQNEPRGSANLVVSVRIMAGAGVGRSHDSVSQELTPIGERPAAGGCRRGVRARKSDGG